MAKQRAYTDVTNTTHPESYRKIVWQRQDFMANGDWIVELWWWHDHQSKTDGYIEIASTLVVIPNFELDEADDIREVLYSKLAENDATFIWATDV